MKEQVIKLTTRDRIGLINMLPGQSNFADMIVIKAMQKELEFTEDEKDKLNIRTLNNNQITWDNDQVKKIKWSKDRERIIRIAVVQFTENNGDFPVFLNENTFEFFNFTQEELQKFKETVDKLDNEEKITVLNFNMCQLINEKFEK